MAGVVVEVAAVAIDCGIIVPFALVGIKFMVRGGRHDRTFILSLSKDHPACLPKLVRATVGSLSLCITHIFCKT